MQNQSWVARDRDAGMSNTGAVALTLRSAQMIGQQIQKTNLGKLKNILMSIGH